VTTTSLPELRVAPGDPAGLAARDTAAPPHGWDPGTSLRLLRQRLTHAQEQLYASGTHAVLVLFQAPDAAGKDGTIKHVLRGVNPQGCRVSSFQQPSALELRHDFLWRCSRELPERGMLGVFNRSYYEDVLVTRVHPELLAAGLAERGEKLWPERYRAINAFERHLHDERTLVVKFFLHLSPGEQRRRLLARLDDPRRTWKFSPADLAERARFGDYRTAYEEAITATSTRVAPWYVIPADDKPLARRLVASVLLDAVDRLDLRVPESDQAALAAARACLLAE
jgi:PPK2 family polyphosphate:nucleotide phosphotransferase